MIEFTRQAAWSFVPILVLVSTLAIWFQDMEVVIEVFVDSTIEIPI